MKKLIVTAITFGLVLFFGFFSSSAVQAAEPTFKDVPANAEYYAAVEYLAQRGIISTSSDYFNPQGKVTRGQLSKMMALSTSLNTNNVTNPGFSDVKTTHEFYPYIAGLVKENVLSGYPDGSFGINKPVKRSHMAKFIALGFKLPDRALYANTFTDLTPNTETFDSATRLRFYNITVVTLVIM